MAEQKGTVPTIAGLVALGGKQESSYSARFGNEVAVIERGAVYIGTHVFSSLEGFKSFIESIPREQS